MPITNMIIESKKTPASGINIPNPTSQNSTPRSTFCEFSQIPLSSRQSCVTRKQTHSSISKQCPIYDTYATKAD